MSTVDSALRQRDDQHQLLSLATARIESYDAVEAPTDECVKVSRRRQLRRVESATDICSRRRTLANSRNDGQAGGRRTTPYTKHKPKPRYVRTCSQ